MRETPSPQRRLMRDKKPLESNKCPTCGKDSGFSLSEKRIKQSRARKFCSRACSTKFRVKDLVIFSTCPVCKKQFRKYPSDGVARKHCSMSCFNSIRRNNLPKYEYPQKEKKHYKMKKINGKQILYHRWAMEQHLGRKLARNEVIHHINGDPHDNRIENLQLTTQSEHMKIEISHRKILPT
jgi:endogenous inhibitor of DNA gyrase (YacG/DUF329 family)